MIDKIFNSVKAIQNGSMMNFEYNVEKSINCGKNEFVILIKPECFFTYALYDVIDSILGICNEYNIAILGFNAFNGIYAQKFAYIENEYYMLNRGARYGFDHLPMEYKEMIKRKYGDAIVLGAYGFLEYAKLNYTAKSLEEITEKHISDKIGNGTYVLPLEYKGDQYAIINAFHPEQLNHFYSPKHITVALICASDTDYKELVNNCIGNYVPLKAESGSIRHHLYQHQEEYGLVINNLFNGVHISPSPLEGIFGYYRYSKKYKYGLSQISLCKKLAAMGIGTDKIFSFLENPIFYYRGRGEDVFNLCESKNSYEIISMIQEMEG